MKRSHQGAPGVSAARRNHRAASSTSLKPPVVDEADVLQVLPAVRNACSSLSQQRDGKIGAPRAAGRRLGQKHRSQPVRRVEPRIEGGRSVQQRVQRGVVVCPAAGQPRASVVLHRANPIEIGEDRLERQRGPAHEPGRQHGPDARRDRTGDGSMVARHLQDGSEQHEQDHRNDRRIGATPPPRTGAGTPAGNAHVPMKPAHSRSRLVKIASARTRNARIYATPEAAVSAM